MGKQVNYRDASRTQWATSETSAAGFPGLDHVNAGSLQRIADATEAMAKNHNDLQRDLKWARESRDSWKKTAEEEQRSASALRGVITKKDKRIRELEAQLAALQNQNDASDHGTANP